MLKNDGGSGGLGEKLKKSKVHEKWDIYIYIWSGVAKNDDNSKSKRKEFRGRPGLHCFWFFRRYRCFGFSFLPLFKHITWLYYSTIVICKTTTLQLLNCINRKMVTKIFCLNTGIKSRIRLTVFRMNEKFSPFFR